MANNNLRKCVDKKELVELSTKSDFQAFIQVIFHLGLLTITTYLCFWLIENKLYTFLIFAILIHGTIFTFLGWAGASHELVHNSVFKTRKMNELFLKLFCLLTWNNLPIFKKTHAIHHACTLKKGVDFESSNKVNISKTTLLQLVTFNLSALYTQLKYHVLNSIGEVKGEWINQITDNKSRAEIIKWSRLVLASHITLMILFTYFNLLPLVIIINFGSYFANFLPVTLANAQHAGMIENTNDYSLNSRTIKIPFLFERLYWGMNYHVEHHTFPHIPFYNLNKLHKKMSNSLPETKNGLTSAIKLVFSYNHK